VDACTRRRCLRRKATSSAGVTDGTRS
jgi:hypothetical protein